MALKKEIAAKIKGLLQQNPNGLSISDIVRKIDINRNTAGRYLENLMVSGQVEMRHFGMAKIYRLAQRVPLSAMLSISSELIMLLDNSLRVLYANEPMLTFLDTTQKDIYGKNIEFTPCITLFDDAYNRLIKGIKNGLKGVEWKDEIASEKKGIVFSCHIAPTVFEEGQRGVSILFEDITEQKRANEKLKESEQRFRTLFEGAAEGILVADTETEKFLYANSAICKMLGYSVRELIKKGLRDIHPKGDLEYVRSEFKAFIKGEKNFAVNIPCLKKDGSIFYANIITSNALIDGKNCIVGFFTDVTEQKRIDEELRESEDRYRTLVEISPDPIILHRDEKIIFMNPAALTLIGASNDDEVIGKNILDFIQPAFRDAVNINIQKDIKGEISPTIELPMVRIDGKLVIVEGRGVKTFIDGNYAIQVALRDVTERKRIDEQLRQSEATARALIDAPTDTVLLLNPKGEILALNKTAALGFGRREDELIGEVVDHLLPEEIARQRRLLVNQLLKGKSVVRFDDKREGRWFDTVAYPIMSKDGEVKRIAIIARDITDLKQKEEELRKSEKRYRALAETSQDLIFIIDRDDRVVYVNSYAGTAIGKTVDQIIGQPRSTLFPQELSLRQQEGLRRVLKSGTLFRREGPMVVSGQNRWFDHFLMPIMGDDKTVTAILGISRDITERQILEESQSQLKDKYRYLIMNSSDIIWESDVQSRFVFVSLQVEKILGYLPEDWIGHTPFEFFDKGTNEQNMLKLPIELRTKKEGIVYSTRWIHKNGSVVILESHVIPLYKKDGTFLGFWGIERQISNPEAI